MLRQWRKAMRFRKTSRSRWKMLLTISMNEWLNRKATSLESRKWWRPNRRSNCRTSWLSSIFRKRWGQTQISTISAGTSTLSRFWVPGPRKRSCSGIPNSLKTSLIPAVGALEARKWATIRGMTHWGSQRGRSHPISIKTWGLLPTQSLIKNTWSSTTVRIRTKTRNCKHLRRRVQIQLKSRLANLKSQRRRFYTPIVLASSWPP